MATREGEQRRRQALELNDAVLQGMVVARMAVERGDTAKALAALDSSIASAGEIITGLIETGQPSPVALLRSTPAVVGPHAGGDGHEAVRGSREPQERPA